MPLVDAADYLENSTELIEDPYAHATNRTHRSHDRFYALANSITENVSIHRFARAQTILETSLHEHIQRWKEDTIHWSSVSKRIAHPSYLRIIGLAKSFTNHEVERALLQNLQKKPNHWFAALTAITGENPIRPDHNFDEAVEAWLAWGREQGII